MPMSFEEILDRPASEIKAPVPAPVGSYHCVVDGPPEPGKSSQKQTNFLRFKYKFVAPMDNVDKRAVAEQQTIGKTINHEFYVTENETTQSYQYRDKTWYRFRVRVTGAVIRCWIDDKEIIAVNYQDKEVRTRVEVRANEPLGFATWETGGALRNIAIRSLTPDEISATNKVD